MEGWGESAGAHIHAQALQGQPKFRSLSLSGYFRRQQCLVVVKPARRGLCLSRRRIPPSHNRRRRGAVAPAWTIQFYRLHEDRLALRASSPSFQHQSVRLHLRTQQLSTISVYLDHHPHSETTILWAHADMTTRSTPTTPTKTYTQCGGNSAKCKLGGYVWMKPYMVLGRTASGLRSCNIGSRSSRTQWNTNGRKEDTCN